MRIFPQIIGVFATAVAVSGAAGCSDAGCGNQIISKVVSPDGKLAAVIFERDCGATTDFSTQVSIIEAASSLSNNGGNVFVADSNHGEAPQASIGGPLITVHWKDARTLQVGYNTRARVFLKEPRHSDVAVEYVTSASSGS
jgi:hypothetical protein